MAHDLLVLRRFMMVLKLRMKYFIFEVENNCSTPIDCSLVLKKNLTQNEINVPSRRARLLLQLASLISLVTALKVADLLERHRWQFCWYQA